MCAIGGRIPLRSLVARIPPRLPGRASTPPGTKLYRFSRARGKILTQREPWRKWITFQRWPPPRLSSSRLRRNLEKLQIPTSNLQGDLKPQTRNSRETPIFNLQSQQFDVWFLI